jgi:hypothetical protein
MSSAEEVKPVEAPVEEVAAAPAPAVEPVVASDVAPVEPAVTEAAPAVEAPAAETTETPAAAEAEAEPATEAAKEEDKKEEPKEELKPIEEGVLEHKKGTSFPKSLLFTKHTVWFGTDAVEAKALESYLKTEKASEASVHNAAWATKTGAGLVFYGEKKDAILGVISLADASEPEADGSNKFHFSSKGVKHTFKAVTKLDRDSWVAQLKTKIAEAKEASAAVTESEEYKSAVETLKKPAKKEEKKEATPAEAAATEEVAKAEEPKTEEAPKEEGDKVEEAKDEAKEEGDKLAEPKDTKRRSTSRKRFSVFGLNKSKKEEKKEEAAAPAEAAAVAEEGEAAVIEAPAEETPAVEAAPVAEDKPAEAAAATEEAAAEEKKDEEKPTKPIPTKRNSFFDVFRGKKSPVTTPATETVPVTEESAEATEAAPVAETAPVIPPVDTADPVAVDAAAAPAAETPAAEEKTDEATATAPSEKQEIKTEKRKSSLPFLGGKKEKAPVEESTEKGKEATSPFSRFRNTIKVCLGRHSLAVMHPH